MRADCLVEQKGLNVPMQRALATLGGLTCHIIDDLPGAASPELVVVLCHGFGAPGTDLVPLGPELLRHNPGLSTSLRFIFPEAPIAIDEFSAYGGRAWWPLSVQRLMLAVDEEKFRKLARETPPGLEAARESLSALVEDVHKQTGLPMSRIVLGGFSQGAMLATDVTLRQPEPPAGLVVLSGTLLCEETWRKLAQGRGPIPVFQSHGRQDPILPFAAAEWLRDLLVDAGIPVDFLAFDGMHTIPLEALEHLGTLLSKLSAGP